MPAAPHLQVPGHLLSQQALRLNLGHLDVTGHLISRALPHLSGGMGSSSRWWAKASISPLPKPQASGLCARPAPCRQHLSCPAAAHRNLVAQLVAGLDRCSVLLHHLLCLLHSTAAGVQVKGCTQAPVHSAGTDLRSGWVAIMPQAACLRPIAPTRLHRHCLSGLPAVQLSCHLSLLLPQRTQCRHRHISRLPRPPRRAVCLVGCLSLLIQGSL